MFVARLDRISGKYVVIVPHDVIVQRDLREGQTISVVLEPLAEYAHLEAEANEPVDARWKLNDELSTYRERE